MGGYHNHSIFEDAPRKEVSFRSINVHLRRDLRQFILEEVTYEKDFRGVLTFSICNS